MLTEKIKSPPVAAMVSSFVCGCITHLFALVTILHNYDNIGNLPGGYGTGAISGRWFLQALGELFLRTGLNYNLPLFNGLVFLLLVAACAGILVATAQIKSCRIAVLVGMLFSVFPPACSTLFFRFTAVFYGTAMLFACTAPFLAEKYRFGWIGSILLIALSLGIYQAYIPMTIGIFVLLMLCHTLRETRKIPSLILRGISYCGILAAGYLLYFAITKLVLLGSDSVLVGYQGIDAMGQISLSEIPRLVQKAFTDVCMIPFADYCGISYRKIIKLAYLLIWIVSIPLLFCILKDRLSTLAARGFFLLLLLIFPVAINFIAVMVPSGWIYTLMVYPLVLLPCLPLILLDHLPQCSGKYLGKLVPGAIAILIFLYIYYANVNYTAMYYENRQVENYVASMVTQVRMTEGFRPDMQWVKIGKVEDPLLGSMWVEEAAYGGNSYALHLINEFSFSDWIENYIGYHIPFASEETVLEFASMQTVQDMPCWPAQGSIRIIEDTVVIKCQDLR